MVILGEQILFTAHETRTARTFFRRLRGFFENPSMYPELAKMVKENGIKTAPGHEAIWLQKEIDGVWRDWGSLQILARSKGSGRGFTVDVVMFDEAQELSFEAQEAMDPATSAAPLQNDQLIFCGTPPNEVANGDVFTKLRTEALSGSANHTSWLEWAMPEGSDLDDPAMWAFANPALGFRLRWERIAAERSRWSDEGFARERGGMWSAAVSAAVIDARSWDDIKDSTSRVTDPVAIAVDISPDRSTASIAIAGARSDGLYHVEVIENRRGTDWVITALAYLVAQFGPVAVVVDGPASSLIPELGTLEVPVMKLGPSEFGAACGLFYDSVMNRRMRHLDQPLFTAAIDGARKRALGDLWAWGRSTSTTDITPVVAGTLALYGFASGRPVVRPKRTRRAVTL
jgi:hypothetical protein